MTAGRISWGDLLQPFSALPIQRAFGDILVLLMNFLLAAGRPTTVTYAKILECFYKMYIADWPWKCAMRLLFSPVDWFVNMAWKLCIYDIILWALRCYCMYWVITNILTILYLLFYKFGFYLWCQLLSNSDWETLPAAVALVSSSVSLTSGSHSLRVACTIF